jgi:hypothetical protein
MTHVIAILKLAQILPKMMTANMNVCPVNRPLQLRPEAFDGVDASALRGGILAEFVIDLHMAKARFVDVMIPAKFIGIERGAGNNMRQDKPLHGFLGARLDNAGNQLAIAFQHPHHAGLVALVTAPLAANRAADKRFIDFDRLADTAKRIIAVLRRHIFADFMAHAPRRLVGHAKLALDFLGGNAVARGAEQKHDIKPVAQRSARPIERRIGGRIDLMAAEIAGIGAPFGNRMELGFAPAFIANMGKAVARLHKMLQTGFFCRETVLKLAESGGFRFHGTLYSRQIALAQGDRRQTSSG